MSTGFRITQQTMAATVLNNLQADIDSMSNIQQQLSSGKRINKPSDDPGGTLQAMQYRASISRSQQYSRNAQDGLGWLGTADNSLTAAITAVNRVRDLALQGANSTQGPSEREAL